MTAKYSESCGPRPAREILILGPELRESARKLRPRRRKEERKELWPREVVGLLPCEGEQAGRPGVGEGGVGDPEGVTGDLPEVGGAQEGLLELEGGQQALSCTPQSKPRDGIAGTAGVESHGSRSSEGPTRTGSGNLMKSLTTVRLAGGSGAGNGMRRVSAITVKVCSWDQCVCYIFFLFFFFSEVLVMNLGVSSGS